ncbi:MAG TPA: nickel-dependent lactate racemase [Clostridiales bacterium]|nr:nickel-dependent lactate racemase [Clostridiales bacterium]
MSVNIPFGKAGMTLHADLSNAEILESHIGELKATDTEDGLVQAAMANPIDSPRLKELAVGKTSCTIIISDHTRPVASKHIIPAMLSELREGNPSIDITLLVATGFHRPSSKEELVAKLGQDIVDRERIVIHNSRDASSNVKIGVLPSGAACVIDKIAAKADLLVAEGFIEPHFFAGFSGGRKSVLPGISDQVTVLGNHCSKFIDSPYARTGVLDGNPLHKDMLAAAEMAHLAYIVNVIIDEDKRVVDAFAGNPVTAHRQGCDLLLKYCKVKPAKRGDIVISSNGGYPLDQNLYQSSKAIATAETCAGEDGVIIMCASCIDGFGGTHFERLMFSGTIDEILERLSKIPPKETIPEMWCVQIFTRIMKKHRIILVTTYLDHRMVQRVNMIPASSPDEALAMAYIMKGRDAKVVVIPDGVATLVVK